jgi:hypothetical protein
MFNRSLLAREAGDDAGARTWWERAAKNGHPDAMDGLADLAEERGEEAEAARWRALAEKARREGGPA